MAELIGDGLTLESSNWGDEPCRPMNLNVSLAEFSLSLMQDPRLYKLVFNVSHCLVHTVIIGVRLHVYDQDINQIVAMKTWLLLI